MARAVVSVAAARERALPPVSVKSGEPADGYAPVIAAGRRLYLPLTQAEFDRVRYLRHRQAWALWGGVGCVGFGLALARFPAMVPLAAVIAALSAVLWGVVWVTLKAYLPVIDVDGSMVSLTRVHDRFAAAVRGDS